MTAKAGSRKRPYATIKSTTKNGRIMVTVHLTRFEGKASRDDTEQVVDVLRTLAGYLGS